MSGSPFGCVALDHLVVAAATLDEGVRWCEGVLGVSPGPGGRHALMGTHNRLLRLHGPCGEGAYLEIIAIDPQAPPPQGRRRWFGLDERPPGAAPALVHWVMRCDDIAVRTQALRALGADPGEPTAASRPSPLGLLSWTISLRDDGRPQAAAALPALIQWQTARESHPATRLPPSGLALQGLAVGPLPTGVRPLLAVAGLADDHRPGLHAGLLTPRGRIDLHSLMT